MRGNEEREMSVLIGVNVRFTTSAVGVAKLSYDGGSGVSSGSGCDDDEGNAAMRNRRVKLEPY